MTRFFIFAILFTTQYAVGQTNRFDVVFSEIMIDPIPNVGLPESEYIELFNRSGKAVQLGGWALSVNNKIVHLPDYTLNVGTQVLLVPASKENEWQDIPDKIALPKWHALTNSSGTLVLFTGNGSVCDALKYNLDQWGDDSFKKEGGWSFECIDVNNLSGTAENWTYSVDLSGGTPGRTNSVKAELPDDISPEVRVVTYESPYSIKICFTENMNFFTEGLIPLFKIKNNTVTISEILPDTVFPDNCLIYFDRELRMNEIHEFAEIDLNDLAGNDLLMWPDLFFGRPDTVLHENEIVINEILFNPRPEGYDFIEIFNRTKKIFNLHSLYFANSNDNDEMTKLFNLTPENVLVFPGDYPVFTLSLQNISEEYVCKNPYFLNQMSSFPSMPDDHGTVTLALLTGTVIDRFHYNRSMHFPLLNSTQGVSLERVSPDAQTDDADNWHSASADCGYASPTAVNSQYADLTKPDAGGFSLENELFSPNSDGFSDILIINYSFDIPETVATVTIFNSKGIAVKKLANNELLGTEGFLSWDGTDDSGEIVSPGIYIIYGETYDPSGKTGKTKLICVVGTGKTER